MKKTPYDANGWKYGVCVYYRTEEGSTLWLTTTKKGWSFTTDHEQRSMLSFEELNDMPEFVHDLGLAVSLMKLEFCARHDD